MKEDKTMFAEQTQPIRNQAVGPTPQQLLEMAAQLMEMAKAAMGAQPVAAPVLHLGKGKCPHCLHIGPIERDFGYREVKVKEADGSVRVELRPQSWCKPCRASPEAHPTRNGL